MSTEKIGIIDKPREITNPRSKKWDLGVNYEDTIGEITDRVRSS